MAVWSQALGVAPGVPAPALWTEADDEGLWVYVDHGQCGRDRGDGRGEEEICTFAGDCRACERWSAMKKSADDLRTKYAIRHEAPIVVSGDVQDTPEALFRGSSGCSASRSWSDYSS